MPSLFGTDKVNPKGKYKELGQLASDDEFSLSDDEKVLFKKSGEIELNLCPETRKQRPKKKRPSCQYCAVCFAIFVVVISIVSVAVVFMSIHSVKTSTEHNTTQPQTSQQEPVDDKNTKNGDGWKVTFTNMGGEGNVRLLDVNGDGIDDIILSSATNDGSSLMRDDESTKFEGLRKRCESKGQDYPCMGNLIALNGHNGSQLWSMKVRSEAFVLNCEDFDINNDDKKDCIATGRMGQLTAFDPYIGKTLWTCEDDKFLEASWNTYHAAELPDWDGDGVPEILIANGGNSSKRPDNHNRDPGRLVALSGATGKPFGTRYLEMPNSRETYMSPVMFTPTDGSATYILFGSGGETVSGDLMGISVKDFCHYVLGDNAEVCDQNTASEYPEIGKDEKGILEKDGNGIFVIYRGKEKGVMVPPVIVDYNNDGVKDILMTTFEGINNLYNGKDLQLVWTADFPGMETYATPAPGYFNEDGYVDFMVKWNLGVWMNYNLSCVSVISGSDGSILWSLESAYMQMSSVLSIATSLEHQDAFLFRVQGRDSKYKWTGDGVVKPDSKEVRRKRHGDDIPENELSLVEDRKQHFYSGLTCEDDLTSYKGEVFVIDSKTVKTPVKVLEIPTQKHIYDANPECSEPQSQGGREGPHSQRNRKKKEVESQKKNNMCSVEEPDIMGSGIIGEVDGDGYLDYISVTSPITILYDAEYCHQGMLAELIIQKVSLEKGLLDGTFKQEAVNAKTSLEDSGVHMPVQREKTFLPMNKQRWNQYFGTEDNNVYR